MQLIIILAIQLSLILVGVIAAISFGVKKRLEILGLSYLLGSGFITISFLLLHWFFDLKLDGLNFLLSFVINFLGFLIIVITLKKTRIIRELFKFKSKKHFKHFSKTERSIFTIISLLVVYSFFENYSWPVIDWDALAFYDFRAKVMTISKGMTEGIELEYFFQYPPYTSFLHVFGYIFKATRVKIAYSFINISLLLSFFNLIRRKQLRLISLIFTLILSSTFMIFEHSTMAYTNLPYTAFFSVGLIYLWFYYEKGISKDLIIGSLLVGLSTWIRSTEPFWIAGLILILISAFKYKINLKSSVLFALFLSFPNKLWRLFLTQLERNSKMEIVDTNSHTSNAIKDFLSQNQSILNIATRMFEVLKYLLVSLAPEFTLLIMLLALTLISNNNSKRVEIFTLLILFGIIFVGTLVFSFTFETWNLIGGSVARMSMIFIPLILYIIAKDLKYEK